MAVNGLEDETDGTGEIMQVVSNLCQQHKLKVTSRQSLAGGVMCGAGAVVGGILAGPLGLIVGALIASFLVAYKVDDKSRLATEVVGELNKEDCNELISELFRNVAPSLKSLTILAKVIENSLIAQDKTIEVLRQILYEKRMRLSYPEKAK